MNREVGLGCHYLSLSSPVPDKPHGFCGRKTPWKTTTTTTTTKKKKKKKKKKKMKKKKKKKKKTKYSLTFITVRSGRDGEGLCFKHLGYPPPTHPPFCPPPVCPYMYSVARNKPPRKAAVPNIWDFLKPTSCSSLNVCFINI